MKFELVPLEIIDPNPYQPRLQMDQAETEELARGIRLKRRQLLPDTLGLMQIPMGRRVGERVQLAFGHRRCEAFRINHEMDVSSRTGDEDNEDFLAVPDWSKMPLQLVDLSDEEMYDLAARENGDRKDINPLERAWSILDAKEKFGWSLQRAASAHGLSKSAASNLTRLLQLPNEVQQMVIRGDLEQRKARELVRLMQIEPPQPEKCIELAKKCIEEGTTTSMVEYGVTTVIEQYKTLQQLRQEMSEATCPYCGHVGLKTNESERVSCPNCRPLRIWNSRYDYIRDKFDQEQRARQQSQVEPVVFESKDEQMAKHKHERYCKHCNHKQTVNGLQVFRTLPVRCQSCGKVEAVGWGGWLKEPKPEPVADDKPGPGLLSHSKITRNGFPAECPTGKTDRICFANCQGCDHHRRTDHGHWLCYHPVHQNQLSLPGIEDTEETPVFPENEPPSEEAVKVSPLAVEPSVSPENGVATEPEPRYSIFECPYCDQKTVERLIGGTYQCDNCAAKWPSSKDFMREVHQQTAQRNKQEEIRGMITDAVRLQHKFMKLPSMDNQFVQQLHAKISQVITDLETLETQADVVFKKV